MADNNKTPLTPDVSVGKGELTAEEKKRMDDDVERMMKNPDKSELRDWAYDVIMRARTYNNKHKDGNSG